MDNIPFQKDSLKSILLVSAMPKAGNPHWRGKLSTVDLFVKNACFVKNIKSKKFPFSKGSLPKEANLSTATVAVAVAVAVAAAAIFANKSWAI